MSDDQHGSAPDSGAPAQSQDQSNTEPKQPQGHMIPKGRFDEVVGQKKAAEAALEEIATSLVEEVPEDMRDIIPDLPPAARIKWVRAAMQKGIFGSPAGVTNPDAKRPGAKAPADLSSMNPRQMMANGYNTSK